VRSLSAEPGEDRGDETGENRLRARVERSEFLGETTRVWLDWKGRELTVRTVDPLDGEVTVGFDAADARVVGVEGGREAEGNG
jgi:thiamine transport system ATP-binding protein